MSGTSESPLHGVRVWLVTDGTAEAVGWLEPFVASLRTLGAASVDVLGVSGVIEQTARDLLGQGAERIARTLRFVRRGQPDVTAFDMVAGSRPDLVLVDHPGILRTLDVVRDTARTGALHVGLVAGIPPADGWGRAHADAFVVADAAAADVVRRAGMADAAVRVAGPPVPAGFTHPPERARARTALGLGDGTVVLVDAAGATGPLVDRLVAAAAVASGATVLFHYGSDRTVADALRAATAARGVRAQMFGHVEDLELYAAASDVVVTGPGNPLVAAYVAARVPVVSLDAALVSAALTTAGAVAVTSDAGLATVLAAIARGGVADSHRAAAAAAIADDPNATFARAVADIWAARAGLRTVAATPSGPAPAGTPARRLEPIGADAPVAAPLAPMSRQQARDQLAALILDERRVEADVASFAADRDRWLARLELAEQGAERDLADFAAGHVRDVTARIAALNDEMAALQRQKDEIRRRVAVSAPGRDATPPADGRAATPDEFEARFRRLERDGELERLRKKALGDT